MKKLKIFLLAIAMVAGYGLTAQVSINTDGSQADASAMLDVKSTLRGFLPPRMNTTQRDDIEDPVAGLMIYNTDSTCLELFNGTEWYDFCTGNSKAPEGTPPANGPEGISFAQDGSLADPSAMLDVYATDLGVLFPRMTTTQRDEIYNPAAGLMIYNSDSACYEMYNGTNWYDFCTGQYKTPQSTPTSNGLAGVSATADGSRADTSAMLEVKSTEKGFLPPRVTTASRDGITSPAEGLMIYNSDDNEIQFYDGSGWKKMGFTGWACGDDFTDARDGKAYSTVQIGNQCWMAEGLNVGTRIDGANNQTDNGTIEKYCYNDVEDSCNVYGGLYQWNEMMQYVTTEGAQGICPSGWHIPTDDEWKTMEMELGMTQSEADGTGFRGTDEGGKIKETGTTHWNSPNTGATNSSGFTALGGGHRSQYGQFLAYKQQRYFWTSTATWTRGLYYNYAQIDRYSGTANTGLSVRCIKD